MLFLHHCRRLPCHSQIVYSRHLLVFDGIDPSETDQIHFAAQDLRLSANTEHSENRCLPDWQASCSKHKAGFISWNCP
ncbi:MAG: hypothetical protein ACK58T_17115, partial [Phycisphaerae bacterium]